MENFTFCAIDPITKEFLGEVTDVSFLRTSENVVQANPPVLSENQYAIWSGNGWVIRNLIIPKGYSESESLPQLPTEQVRLNQPKPLENESIKEFFEDQLNRINLEIVKKFEQGKPIPKKWSSYKKVILKNLKKCESEKIYTEDSQVQYTIKTVYEKSYDQALITNYDQNGYIRFCNGYDFDYINKTLTKKQQKVFYDYIENMNVQNVTYAKQKINDNSVLFSDTLFSINYFYRSFYREEDNEYDFFLAGIDDEQNKILNDYIRETSEEDLETPKNYKKPVLSNIPSDFFTKIRRIEVIDQNNIDSFVDKYGDHFSKYERRWKIPSFYDYLHDEYIFAQHINFKKWLYNCFDESYANRAEDQTPLPGEEQPPSIESIKPLRKNSEYFSFIDKDFSEDFNETQAIDYNLVFDNIKNIDELIESETDLNEYTEQQINPSKPTPRG